MNNETDSIIGTIQLTQSTSLVFSVRPWKGRMLANVRKFVSGSKYEGPTKAGLAMVGDVLVSVIGALTQLRAEVPEAEEKQFAKIRKSAGTEIVITLVPPDDLKALPSVDVREYLDRESYTGPTKKGVRFPWDKLSEFICLLEAQARHLGASEREQPDLFPETRPCWVKQAEKAGDEKKPSRDSVFHDLLPKGPKDFPGEFTSANTAATQVVLPDEPISVVAMRGGGYAVVSELGFHQPVRNPTEGDFLCYSHLKGHRTVNVPVEMISVFAAVKAYENYVRELRRALVQAYEQKCGHRPVAEYKTKEAFRCFGLPWIERSQ